MNDSVAKKLILWLVPSFIILCSCQSYDKEHPELNHVQEEALEEYRTACQRLQNMANWMSVFLKLKSAWTNATANSMAGSDYRGVAGFINVPIPPERPAMDRNSSQCRSMKNLHVTLQTFIHYQVQLLQLKAVLANILLKFGVSRIGDTNESFKKKLRNLENLNNTLVDVFDKLKHSQIILTTQNTMREPSIQSFKDSVYGKGQNLSSYLLQSQSGILRQIQNAINVTQEQKWTRTLFQTGDFFQNMGQALDKFFTLKITEESDPRNKD